MSRSRPVKKDTSPSRPKTPSGMENEPSMPPHRILHLQQTIGNRAVRRLINQNTLQRKPFQFDGHDLDSSDMERFRLFCQGMASVNRQRLQDLVPYLLKNKAGIDSYQEIVAMVRMVWRALGQVPPAVVRQLPMDYQAVLGSLQIFKGQIPKYETVYKTIVAAAIIHANADLIAMAGPQARMMVLCLTGEQPETGFDNESAEAIRQRTSVVVIAWQNQATDPNRLRFFNTGFGSDPCIGARLNGVAEFLAMESGIPEEALNDSPWDVSLGSTLLKLAQTFFGDDEKPDWDAFLGFLKTNHANLVRHPDFSSTYTQVKLAL